MGAGARGNFGNTQGNRLNYKIHQGRQDKHIEGTNNYKQQLANGKNPGILTEDPNKLLKEGSGKGKMITPTKESVDFGRVIGKYYDTTRATIHYDSNGNAHIVPAAPRGFKR